MVLKRHMILVFLQLLLVGGWAQASLVDLPSQFDDDAMKHKIKLFIEQGFGKTTGLPGYHIERVIKEAESYLGVRHCMGGQSKQCIDCSGLVMQAHSSEGIVLHHSGNEQARYGDPILEVDKLKRGDLVFFFGTYPTSDLVTHSGIYLGEGQFIHVSAKRGTIVSTLLDGYWAEHFLFGSRLAGTP